MPTNLDHVTPVGLNDALLLARRGTAYYSRKLNELSDDAFDAPSRLPGWSRRHVIAHVGYNARALTRLVEWARTGNVTPMYESTTARSAEIEFGATLTPDALRHLHHHAAITLDVEWRDLPADRWSALVQTAQGRKVPASETVWMRVREVWVHAIDLDNGAWFDDLPRELIDLLLDGVRAMWRRRHETVDLELVPLDRAATPTVAGEVPRRAVRGSAADLLAWATGRGNGIVVGPNSSEPPPWL